MNAGRNGDRIRDLLKASHARCNARHGLVPRTRHPVLRLQGSEIAERRERFLEQIGGLGSELDRARLVPEKGRHCLLITDADGVVVEAYVPEGQEAEFARHGLVPGGVWDERVAGTNGIAMALRADSVLSVVGGDHFHDCFNGFACSSAPLHDGQDNLLGSLTLVGSARRRGDEIAWCEQVLRLAGSRFQAQLFRKFHGERLTARIATHSPDRSRVFESMVACDEDGMIIASVALSRDGAPPAEHRALTGRHLSELRGLDITLRGPAMVVPRRMVSLSGPVPPAPPPRARASARLAALQVQGGGLDALVERARRLAANRVPLLVCGEAGVEKERFARALVEDVLPEAVSVNLLNAARSDAAEAFVETLQQLRFLSEYPVPQVPPVLVLLNAERLEAPLQDALRDFLETLEPVAAGAAGIARQPLLIFTAGRDWRRLRDGEAGELDPALLYLMSGAVVELPPVRSRDLPRVLEQLLAEEFGGRLEISDAAREVLLGHAWPGNLRELRAVLREAMICGNGRRINRVDLPPRLTEARPMAPAAQATRQMLRDALDSTGWNVTRAARLLGRSRATVNRWIAAEGLCRPK